jgi:hypothetical protein
MKKIQTKKKQRWKRIQIKYENIFQTKKWKTNSNQKMKRTQTKTQKIWNNKMEKNKKIKN